MDELTAEVIADGMHLPPALLKLTVKTKGVDGVVLVTDAMRGAGMPAGAYKLGSLRRGQDVYSDGRLPVCRTAFPLQAALPQRTG